MENREGGAPGRGGKGGCLFFYCGGVFMTRLTSLTPAEKAFLDDAVAEAERAAGKKLSRPHKNIILNQACDQIAAQRYAEKCRLEREQERHAAEFSWQRRTPFRR